MTKLMTIALALIPAGLGLLALTLYLAPSAAYEIQGPFQEFGESTTGVVVSKAVKERSYIGGGRRGRGEKTYEEPTVRVELETGRTVTIADLVLTSDYESLSEGDEVEVTFVRGKEAREALPKGPFYLLSSSVNAGPLSLLGWAFNGRPASGLAIFSALATFMCLGAGGIFLLLARDMKRNAAAA